MARNLDFSGENVSTESNTGFAPLPAGKYEATVFDVKDGTYGEKSANSGRPNLKVQFRISDGQKGANRRVFETVPLFSEWASGSDAFGFFRFFAAVQGKSESEFRKEVAANPKKVSLPDNKQLLGKAVTLDITVDNDDYAYNKYVADNPDGDLDEDDFQRNNIRSISKAGGGTSSEGGGKSSTTTVIDL